MASKVIDGLFVGDGESSQDLGFLMQNKIFSVVNTSCLQYGNNFSTYGNNTYNLMQRNPICHAVLLYCAFSCLFILEHCMFTYMHIPIYPTTQ